MPPPTPPDRRPEPKRVRLLIGVVLVAATTTALAVPIVVRSLARSQAGALADRIDRAQAAIDAMPRWHPPAYCSARGSRHDDWVLPRPLSAAYYPDVEALRATVLEGRALDEAALALTERARLDELPWQSMACGRESFVPLGEGLELLLLLRFAQHAGAGGERCLQTAREVIQVGFAEAARPVGYPNDTQEYILGTVPPEWVTVGLLRCAEGSSPDAVASLGRQLSRMSPPSPARHIGLDRISRARSYSDTLTVRLEESWLVPFNGEPAPLIEMATHHLVVAELATRIRADAIPEALEVLDHPDLADGYGGRARAMIERYATTMARVRMLALALFAIAGEPLDDRLRDPDLADPFTGRPFEWDGEQLASPGIRTKSGGVVPMAVRVAR